MLVAVLSLVLISAALTQVLKLCYFVFARDSLVLYCDFEAAVLLLQAVLLLVLLSVVLRWIWLLFGFAFVHGFAGSRFFAESAILQPVPLLVVLRWI